MMIYEDYYTISEINRWDVETDIPWDKLEKKKAHHDPKLLDQLREACIIESYHPISTGGLMNLLRDDIDATGVLSVELYEGFRHFFVLKKYLELVEYKNALTDFELEQLRLAAIKNHPKQDITRELINFIFSEHFAAYFFLRIAQSTREPVLKQIATYISKDEFRHSQAAYDLMKKRLETKKDSADEVLEVAYNFRHYGNDIVTEVPTFQKNDITAINTFMKKIELLTGRRLIDYVKEKKIK